MEKFNLKWNDFQTNVSKSFRCLRQEEDFFDVTLVSDDEVHISSHKLVLSASSEFFKKILKQCKQFNPLIYLSGVHSKELNSIMNYIYNGEVELYQEELDIFLDIAQKLKIDGLTSTSNSPKVEETEIKHQDRTFYEELKDEFPDSPMHQNNQNSSTNVVKTTKSRTLSKEIAIASSNMNVKEATDELVIRNSDNFECRTCGKTAKNSSDIRRHVEIHIEGLSYECNICGNTFRSRMSLNFHIRKHRK